MAIKLTTTALSKVKFIEAKLSEDARNSSLESVSAKDAASKRLADADVPPHSAGFLLTSAPGIAHFVIQKCRNRRARSEW